MPSLRVYRASDEFAREMAGRLGRVVLLSLGAVLILVGLAIEFLPLPLHLPGMAVVVIGLMLVLRNSFRARREFVRLQYRHPKVVFPFRRLLRREPEVFPVAWQQFLRMERVILPQRYRFAVRTRRRFKLRRRARAAAAI
jgi:hypothetical protein